MFGDGASSEVTPWARHGVLTDVGFDLLPTLQPSADLASVLAGLDLSAHADCELTEILRAWSRVEAWVAAGKAKVIAAIATGRSLTTPEGVSLSNPEREEIAVALCISPRSAESEICMAWALTQTHVRTLEELESGGITVRAARVIVEETSDLSVEELVEVESRVLPKAGQQVPSEVRRACRRAVHAVVPQHQAELAKHAQEDRCVTLTPASSGMAYLEAYLPAPEAQVIYNVLTEAGYMAKRRDRELARRSGFDPSDLPPIGTYRADALAAFVAAAAPGLIDDGGDLRKIHAHVVLDLPTALGLADNPGELRGYGPIPGELARELACGADWDRWITSADTGQLIDIGAVKYRPSARLREVVVARDQSCRFPGCSYPAERCDLDHATAWNDGGATTLSNLGALCRRHHRLKTHTRWELIESQPDGTCTWLTPSGRRVTSLVEPLLAPPPSGAPDGPSPPEASAGGGSSAA